jgi:hypothetical protein
LLVAAWARAQEGPSISALNRGEYTQEDSTRRESFRDRLDLDLHFREFLIGGRYQMDEEVRVDTLLGEGLTKRYVEYRKDWFSARAGNSYSTFGRGLTFRSFEDDNVYIDRDVDGIKVSVNHARGEIQALAGRPRSDVTHKRDDVIAGGSALGQVIPNVSLGGTYVRRDAANTPQDSSWGRPVEELGSGIGRVILGDLDLYGEYAQRWTWGRYDPLLGGWIGMNNVRGQATYGSLSFTPVGWGLTVDYKDYRNFDFAYNAPPWVNRLNRNLNKAHDEQGWQGELTTSPTPSVNLVGNFSDGWSHDYTERLQHGYGEFKLQSLDKGLLLLWGEGITKRLVEPAIFLKKEGAGHAEGTYYLTRVKTVSATAELRRVRSLYLSGQDFKYWDNEAILTYSQAPFFSVSAIVRQTSIRVLEYNNDDLWPIGQVVLTFGRHQVTVRYGKERGGLDCSSGICIYKPPFNGLEVYTISRF